MKYYFFSFLFTIFQLRYDKYPLYFFLRCSISNQLGYSRAWTFVDSKIRLTQNRAHVSNCKDVYFTTDSERFAVIAFSLAREHIHWTYWSRYPPEYVASHTITNGEYSSGFSMVAVFQFTERPKRKNVRAFALLNAWENVKC